MLRSAVQQFRQVFLVAHPSIYPPIHPSIPFNFLLCTCFCQTTIVSCTISTLCPCSHFRSHSITNNANANATDMVPDCRGTIDGAKKISVQSGCIQKIRNKHPCKYVNNAPASVWLDSEQKQYWAERIIPMSELCLHISIWRTRNLRRP